MAMNKSEIKSGRRAAAKLRSHFLGCFPELRPAYPLALALMIGGAAATASGVNGTSAGDVTAQRMRTEAAVDANWMTYGRTYGEQRFSPLAQINEQTVHRLGIAWSTPLPSPDGLGATPIVVDGVIYMSGSQDMVEALDARTGRELWLWRPQHLDLRYPYASWTSRFNRGVAVWNGKVFIGTGDCRLIALSAATGQELWDVPNCDPAAGYGSHGAPRVAKDMVLIGAGGADTGARGYMSAYDAGTGRLIWRFYTVPGDPAKSFEQPILAQAAKSWQGKDGWKNGGGTVEDSIVYDPELNRIYFGTDTAMPWDRTKGDALFSDSIIAVDADTGRYLWHYQEVPDDAWDYVATAQIILADLTVDGQPHKVLLQSAKDGFFYVIDRETGQLLSATPFVKVTWASRIDSATGRPVLSPDARYYLTPNETAFLWPSIEGARDWQAMSFSTQTGLAYIPAANAPSLYGGAPIYLPPPTAKIQPEGQLIAWDPIARKARWSVTLKYPFNGGTLVTAGNLVFQGTAEGSFVARRATDGGLLSTIPVVSSTQAQPVTYLYQGKQYVLLPVGASGDVRAIPEYGDPPSANGPSRLIAFALDAHGTVPKGVIEKPPQPKPPPRFGSPTDIARGRKLYFGTSCALCHGPQMDVPAGGTTPDLRYLPQSIYAEWNRIVIGGALAAAGMPSFKGALSVSDAQAIRSYVIEQAWKLYDSKHSHGDPIP